MGHRMIMATAFAAASVLATGAYAGSPYYDADGVSTQSVQAPAVRYYHNTAPVAAEPRASVEGGTVASAEDAPVTRADPAGTIAMPKMDADGRAHPESDSSYYEHAEGTDGSQVEATDANPAPKPDPVYTAAMPKMDADGRAHPESASSFYNHAEGTDGSP